MCNIHVCFICFIYILHIVTYMYLESNKDYEGEKCLVCVYHTVASTIVCVCGGGGGGICC